MATPRDNRLASRLARDLSLAPELAQALRKVPRKEFLDPPLRSRSEDDIPLPIGHRQTTSQPLVITRMLDLLTRSSRPRRRALEIGSGCGYQTALLAELYGEVFAVERIRALAELTRTNLRRLGYNSVRVKHGDGTKGLPEVGEFDGIIVSAATGTRPEALVAQLAEGARLVLPLDEAPGMTKITALERRPDGEIDERTYDSVAFVPLLGGTED